MGATGNGSSSGSGSPGGPDTLRFFIDGAWRAPHGDGRALLIDPASEETRGEVALASDADIDAAVDAARRALGAYAATSPAQRAALIGRVVQEIGARADAFADIMREEMGAPVMLAKLAQTPAGMAHFGVAAEVLKTFEFEAEAGTTRTIKEPVGVVAMITPWNWPLNQMACKIAPALATGCTMVLKPSEITPGTAALLAQALDAAGVPPGVFNLIQGDGPGAGAALAAHPGVDMVSFTGSARGGVAVAQAAAPSIKRVSQELGGKSPYLMLDEVDAPTAVGACMQGLLMNSGQSCNAPTRLIVPRARHEEAAAVAQAIANAAVVGDPRQEATQVGPISHAAQYERVNAHISKALADGAVCVAGGAERPDGLARGYYVRPTVFAGVSNDMALAREEVFGPVLAIIPVDSEDEAVAVANDTPYGLAAYVASADPDKARAIARQIRAGQVSINGAPSDFTAPFGGYKQSGNGREWGAAGFEEFLEHKALMGYAPQAAGDA